MLWFQKLLLQCAFLEVICFSFVYNTRNWAKIPTHVSALKGSCVVIPCLFNFSRFDEYAKDVLGMWQYENFGKYINHPNPLEVVSNFKGRTDLIGDLQKHNCTLKIDAVKVDDTGPFCFRFEVPEIDRASYINHMVLIHVKDSPDVPSINRLSDVKAGIDLAVTCSVPHTCPSNPPAITWSRTNATLTVHHKATGNAMWEVSSVLKFIPLASDHMNRLTCTAQYWGGQQANISVLLNVKYKPAILSESACTVDITGQVTCQCIVDSNPPPLIEWRVSDSILNESNTGLKSFSVNNSRGEQNTVTIGVLQGGVAFTANIFCSATNTLGKASLSFTRPMSDLFIYITISVVAAVLIIAIVAAVRRLRIKRSERKQQAPEIAFRNNYGNTQGDIANDIYQNAQLETKSGTPDGFTNDVYANVQAFKVVEDIYENVDANIGPYKDYRTNRHK
ncbi:myelin-associated glycoprotein-like isoform X2 [Acipenser ruthenus]|uniref:myelin-associated glycoprotein-like isoform X2 n=1 Tax=Acipenser ruthenus TaxID=7906 RepID=UPI0027410053|nr:myelin-associated glycoprotein-like isoform X2 [Acipenser ruthenus]XP_058865261.1 myelin-associated glycoprotein-like isoform X2 [Acipenser ruthenus]